MKKFLAESAIVNLALIAFFFVYYYVERLYGAQVKWTVVALSAIAFSVYAWRKWRAQKDEMASHGEQNPQ